MLSSRATTLSLSVPKILFGCSRNVRKGFTIPLKKVNSPIPRRIEETYSEKELKKMRRDNTGIAYGMMRRVESGFDENVDADPEDFFENDFDAFDAGHIINEKKKLAEKDFLTKHFHNVKRKHFKEEKLPNMITYIEKQQIKHLHKEDPEFWTIDKLAESFPASTAIIKKVLNSKFTAYTVEAVQKHDKSVRRNWDLFQKGKLHFNEELEAHYKTFVGRLKFETNVNEIKKFLPPPCDFSNQRFHEFSDIIASSKKYQKQREKERKQLDTDESGNIILTSKRIEVESIDECSRSHPNSSHFTLDELRKNINSKREKDENEALISERAPKKLLSSSVKVEETRNIYQEFDYLNKETGVVDKKLPYDFTDGAEDYVPFRIRIPERLWQKDKLYQVKDCFYDDQGIFLYRVPGLF